jgi:hypothetical protein
LLKEINLENDLEDIVRAQTKKRSCNTIKNTIDKDGDKNE